ncbi:MAG: flagellar protein FlaG [Spirochaetales bacterium]|nr:flagellar protein FlaG [Spirochaetales bacterium]
MELDISSIQGKTVQQTRFHTNSQAARAVEATKAAAKEAAVEMPDINVEQYLKDIMRMTDTFNRKLKFTINRELEQVVVKVIDRETDKVIKEIPPAELQRLHIRMKEALGLLFDEKI